MHNHSNYVRLSLSVSRELLSCSYFAVVPLPAAAATPAATVRARKISSPCLLDLLPLSRASLSVVVVVILCQCRPCPPAPLSLLSLPVLPLSLRHVPQPARFLSKIISYLLTSIELLQCQLQLQLEERKRWEGGVAPLELLL